MSVTVKAYLYRGKVGNSETEIRRFPWNIPNSTFCSFQGKISQVFPTLQQSAKFTLHWKDVEGDYIAFSSDEELKEALTNVENNIFKVHVSVSKGGKPYPSANNRESCADDTKDDNDDGPHHPHIVCDGCEGPVRGVRFKCNVCPDYDLCIRCKRQGKHQEHPMTAIRKPMPHPWAGFFVNGRPFGPGGCGAPPFCPPPPYGAEGTGPGSQEQQMPNFHGPWGRFFRRQMRRYCSREQGKQQEKGTDDKAAEDKEQNDEEEETECTPEEYLQNVGEQVAAMLDPLGIDVQVDVEHASAKKTCGKGKCQRGNPMDAGNGGSSNSNSDENEWTLVTPDKAAAQQEDYFDEDEPTLHGIPLLEPKVAHALNQMKAMGFSDDGGWLSRLLIAKDGDIGQVLDALKPSLSAHNPNDHVA